MFAVTKVMRQSAGAAHAERVPLIKFIGKRSIPASIDHTPHVHPASPSSSLPDGFAKSSSATTFSSYRQQAQQHGPLGRGAPTLAASSGHSLGPVAPSKGQFFDRSELPTRFRRTPYSQAEIDAIETGGATLVC